MNFKYILVAFFILRIILSISLIGEERKPFTRGDAIFGTIMDGIIIYGLLNWI